MGLTKRKDSYYIEFPVIDDGKTLKLARGVLGAKLKRWSAKTTNRTVAREQEAMIMNDLMKERLPGKRAKTQAQMTFKALAHSYVASPPIKRQACYRWKVNAIENYLLPVFCDRLLTTITPGMIEGYLSQRRMCIGRYGKSITTGTVNHDLALLKSMFSFALGEEWIEKSPACKVRLDYASDARDRVLEPEEFSLIQAHANPKVRDISLIAYETAMRQGEILNLTWDKVDLKAGFIRLKAGDTKTNENRIIPLTSKVQAVLRERQKVRRLNEPRVFLINGRNMRRDFARAVHHAGIENFRFHDLRHTAVTNMRRAGIDHLTIMKITGHATLSIFKRYNSFLERDLKAAASRFNTYLTHAHPTNAEVSGIQQ